jgi:hypothetical protein
MGTYHEWGYGGTRRRLVLKQREEVDEEADNDSVDSVDSLICACDSRIKWYCEGRLRGFRRIQSETTVRQNMGTMFWSLATEVMVILNLRENGPKAERTPQKNDIKSRRTRTTQENDVK